MRGGGRGGLSQWVYSCVHHVTWIPNKLWRSNSIFNLWPEATEFLQSCNAFSSLLHTSFLDFVPFRPLLSFPSSPPLYVNMSCSLFCLQSLFPRSPELFKGLDQDLRGTNLTLSSFPANRLNLLCRCTVYTVHSVQHHTFFLTNQRPNFWTS